MYAKKAYKTISLSSIVAVADVVKEIPLLDFGAERYDSQTIHVGGKEAYMRIGIGYDIHQVEKGIPLYLGGLHFQDAAGSKGHSDGDVVIHALVDALLGALGKGDIGDHFPDTDPSYKNISSSQFLSKAIQWVRAEKLRVVNVDINIFCKTPKLGADKKKIAENLAGSMEIAVNCINVKAKSMNGIGELGKGEAIAAQAVVLLERA